MKPYGRRKPSQHNLHGSWCGVCYPNVAKRSNAVREETIAITEALDEIEEGMQESSQYVELAEKLGITLPK